MTRGWELGWVGDEARRGGGAAARDLGSDTCGDVVEQRRNNGTTPRGGIGKGGEKGRRCEDEDGDDEDLGKGREKSHRFGGSQSQHEPGNCHTKVISWFGRPTTSTTTRERACHSRHTSNQQRAAAAPRQTHQLLRLGTWPPPSRVPDHPGKRADRE